MKICDLETGCSVADRIGPGDVNQIAEAGFRVIVCNLPDGEIDGQPAFATIEAEAAKFGIRCVYLPVADVIGTTEVERQFAALMAAGPKPVLAYCRTGRRSAVMWARHHARTGAGFDIPARAQSFGFDVSAHLD